MSKTLADMTPEERQACVGMWCDVSYPDAADGLWIIHGFTSPTVDVEQVGVYREHRTLFPEYITPRFDLPRAWNPDGTPPGHADLPEPKWPGFWEVDGLIINVVDKDGEVLVEWEEESDYAYYGTQTRTLWLSRKRVLAIIAAAKLAEEKK